MTDAPTDAAPDDLTRPWGGESRTADLGPDLPAVHYAVFPDRSTGDAPGTPLVLAHGLGGSHVNWVRLAPLLQRHGPVLVPDLAGFGLTRATPEQSTVAANVRLLGAFLRQVAGGPVVLAGNSMGGMVSLFTARAVPDLVERLVLLDPAIPTRRRDTNARVGATFALYAVPQVGEGFVRAIERRGDRQRVLDTTNLCFADPTRADPAVLDAATRLVAYRRRHVPEAGATFLAASRSILRVLRQGRRYAALLPELRMPVLLVHGEEDRLVPVAAARSAAQQNPSWEVHLLPGVGHVPMLEVPGAVAGLVGDWLGRTVADRVA